MISTNTEITKVRIPIGTAAPPLPLPPGYGESVVILDRRVLEGLSPYQIDVAIMGLFDYALYNHHVMKEFLVTSPKSIDYGALSHVDFQYKYGIKTSPTTSLSATGQEVSQQIIDEIGFLACTGRRLVLATADPLTGPMIVAALENGVDVLLFRPSGALGDKLLKYVFEHQPLLTGVYNMLQNQWIPTGLFCYQSLEYLVRPETGYGPIRNEILNYFQAQGLLMVDMRQRSHTYRRHLTATEQWDIERRRKRDDKEDDRLQHQRRRIW
ncbi:hypothetical protein HDU99_006188 [Rhizoclosmatium hyalinum]|nr:hypothetical protein HDU99_006188 [Rhizoclosmatium hyalinum]